MTRGRYIAFEGLEGCGKSTHVTRLAATLNGITTREPGGTSIGASLRAAMLDTSNTMLSPRAEALMMAADRAQHVHEVIRPALQRGTVVLCDRYLDSSLAYQGIARGLSTSIIADINTWATDGLFPHHTYLLDLDPEVGLARRYGAGDTNRLDREDLTFHQRVRDAFLSLAHQDPYRFTILDAALPTDTLLAHTHRHLTQTLL